MSVVELPSITWGDPASGHRALLVHGLGSDAATMWEIGEHLAREGWFAVAVDQRGHGTAPRTDSYRIEDYARDLLAIPRDRAWDLVVGHSIGGASVVRASAIEPTWTTRLALIDPALATTETDRAEIRARQLRNNHEQTVEEVARDNPRWNPRTVNAAVNAQRTASEFALVHSCDDNPDWDVLAEAAALSVPTLVFQGDPAVLARYTNEQADALEAANPLITRAQCAGTGHNPHRDETGWFCRVLSEWLDR
jgi:pimeloyl-ACP methyl ester carboxylesterase